MSYSRTLLLALAIAAAPALAQQPATGKTTEQQARSYIVSAFMTGAAPMVLSEDVTVTPELRQRLGLAPNADSRAVYQALVQMTSGKALSVRDATGDEIAKSQARAEAGKPLFALEAGDATLVLQYDLQRDSIGFVGQPGDPVAVASPVTAPPPPEKLPEPAPAAAPPVSAVQVVEPREPRMVKPAAPPVAQPPAQATRSDPRAQAPRRSGPCVIKPVMSDQDLVNCGARPPH